MVIMNSMHQINPLFPNKILAIIISTIKLDSNKFKSLVLINHVQGNYLNTFRM